MSTFQPPAVFLTSSLLMSVAGGETAVDRRYAGNATSERQHDRDQRRRDDRDHRDRYDVHPDPRSCHLGNRQVARSEHDGVGRRGHG